MPDTLTKCPTGIHGLDTITGGGLPSGRPTLICGSSGCGKTLFGMEFLIRGIQQYNENGIFVSFEERPRDLAENVASLGYDLPGMIADKKLIIDQISIDRSEITETGEFDLEGLFIRLAFAIEAVGAKRVVLDTIETLFAALTNAHVIRSELRRLFFWLKEKGVTAIVTGERGSGTLTRNGLEEYVSDCVILLDMRVTEQVATRRLRVVKYRGTAHGTNEYPFLIDEQGITVLPITGINLSYPVSRELVSTGIDKLDRMLCGTGYYRGSSLLVSGTAGTGKTSIAAHFVDAACRRGEPCIYFAFEESPDQISRNMQSIGIDLASWAEKGLLHFAAFRPTSFGLETHLSTMLKLVEQIKPLIVVLDPVSSFMAAGTEIDARAMLMRLIDFLKLQRTTALMTTLTSAGHAAEQSEVGISSLIDTWVMLHNLEQAGERTRTLSIVKSRGMSHSNQARELLLTANGIKLVDVFVGPNGGILTGSARIAQEAADRATLVALNQDVARKQAALQRKRNAVLARIAEMQSELTVETEEVELAIAQQNSAASILVTDRTAQAQERENTGDQR
ncbi:MAG TPA: circadian clock protein KaiC [Acetobacteraceae bacterium]|nr:circadian clock protein KaiC [Acetobacteraceae bacterium]